MNHHNIVVIMMHCAAGACFLGATISCSDQEPANLEHMSQDYVLEMKRIMLHDYPHAFNPSIVRWQGNLLLCFRVVPEEPPYNPFNSLLGLVMLDENFEPIAAPQILSMRTSNAVAPSRTEDGRLITCNGRLYLVYSDCEDVRVSRGGFRVYIAELTQEDGQWQVKAERINSFPLQNARRREKNWVPFISDDTLLLAYTINPHLIVQPDFGNASADTVAFSQQELPWNFGELRGGTPALLDGDNYLAFFHSSQRMKTVHSHGEERLHYFMGAYTFSAEFPFALTSISTEPIIGKQFYTGTEYTPYPKWRHKQVVFPGGFIIDEQYIWVAYGRQDHEMWVVKIDKKKLYATMQKL